MNEDIAITRRGLIGLGGAALATAVLPAATARASRRPQPRHWLDREVISGYVGEIFELRGEQGGTRPVRLVSVRDLAGTTSRGRSLAGRNDAYVLTFKPLSGTPSGQSIMTLDHSRLGSAQLFAVAGVSTYTVIINRSEPLGTSSGLSGRAVRMRKRRPRRRRRRRALR